MDITLRTRDKCKAEEVGVGQCFKEVKRNRCLLVIDLTMTDMFREPAGEGTAPVLRDDVVYVVDMETGVVDVVPKTQEVYYMTVRAEEVA